MNFGVIAVIVWLVFGLVLLAYILKHNIGKVLKGILSLYAVLGVVFAASLFLVNNEILTRLYHAWVTVLLFTLIMLVLAVGGK